MEVYVPVPDGWVDWEPSHLLLGPSVLAYYYGLMLCRSEANKEHTWWTSIIELLDFGLNSFFAADRHGVLSCSRRPTDMSLQMALAGRCCCLIVHAVGLMM